jgi:hypothetical protein
MTDLTEYFSFQGQIFIGQRNADGTRQPARWVFDGSALSWALSVKTEDKRESWSGTRGLAARLKTERDMTIKVTLGQLNLSNLVNASDGSRVDIVSGTASGEAIGSVAAGDVWALKYSAVSAVVLTATGPVTLVLNTDYTYNADTGVIKFLTTKTGVTAAYSYAAHSVVTAFTGGNLAWYLLFDGMNTVVGAEGKVVGEVYNISWDPASEITWINEAFGDLPLSGKAMLDPYRQGDAQYGGYARVKYIDPTPV